MEVVRLWRRLVLDQAHPLLGPYLRIGPLQSFHFRLDMPDVSMPTANTGVGRAGLAYNYGRAGGVGVFVGVPICYVTCVYGAGGMRADLRVPIRGSFDLSFSGFTHAAPIRTIGALLPRARFGCANRTCFQRSRATHLAIL